MLHLDPEEGKTEGQAAAGHSKDFVGEGQAQRRTAAFESQADRIVLGVLALRKTSSSILHVARRAMSSGPGGPTGVSAGAAPLCRGNRKRVV